MPQQIPAEIFVASISVLCAAHFVLPKCMCSLLIQTFQAKKDALILRKNIYPFIQPNEKNEFVQQSYHNKMSTC